jgi:ubiquinone/menaquinone biosynthesis C-methylase UbiE
VGDRVRFRTDLYQGTAAFYDRYRVPYPTALLDDLVSRTGLSGTGRLIDLACGPGVVTLALCPYVAEAWGIDQEPDMVAFARAKARETGAGNTRWSVGRAEDVEVDGSVDLVTVGTAFHRLDRRRVARLMASWLRPGGHVALLWSGTPWPGERDWQQALGAVTDHWMAKVGERIPPALEAELAAASSEAILNEAGLEWAGRFEFSTPHEWTVETLVGWMYSTSVFSRQALGAMAGEFERDVRRCLLDVSPSGSYEEDISFAYELASRR